MRYPFLLCITGDREAGIMRIQKAHNFKLAPFVLLLLGSCLSAS